MTCIRQRLRLALDANSFGRVSNRAEETRFGRLNVVGVDVERRPITDAIVLVGSDGDNAELGILLQQRVAQTGPFSRPVSRNHQQIGQSLAHVIGNIRVI